MRLLILSAIFAAGAAAPSGLAPVPLPLAAPGLVPGVVAIPTVSPGDVEAAVVNAKVFAEDLTIAAVDKARELNEKATIEQTDKIIENNALIKEKVEETFWSEQDQKWQTLDALKTAEATIQGSLASNSEALAKSAVLIPYIASTGPLVANFAPLPLPISPIVYSGLQEKPEDIKQEKLETLIKASEDKKSEALVKSDPVKNLDAKPSVPLSPIAPALAAPLLPTVKLIQPWLAPNLAPVYVPSVQPIHPLLTPTIIKTQW